MADVRVQTVMAVIRNEKREVKKDIHGCEQKYLSYGYILQIMLTTFSHSYVHAPLLFDFVAFRQKGRVYFFTP